MSPEQSTQVCSDGIFGESQAGAAWEVGGSQANAHGVRDQETQSHRGRRLESEGRESPEGVTPGHRLPRGKVGKGQRGGGCCFLGAGDEQREENVGFTSSSMEASLPPLPWLHCHCSSHSRLSETLRIVLGKVKIKGRPRFKLKDCKALSHVPSWPSRKQFGDKWCQ